MASGFSLIPQFVQAFEALIYSAQILDHFHHPRNIGEIANASAVVEATNPVCGDVLKLWANLRDGTIAEVKFKVAGCVPAVACGSWLAEWLQGQSLHPAPSLSASQIDDALGGLPPASKHASLLASQVLSELLDKLSASLGTASRRPVDSLGGER